MKNESLVIYRDVPVIIMETLYKTNRVKSRKKLSRMYGDVPICVFNSETKQLEAVVNNRGNAYANRRAKRYWKNKKKAYKETYDGRGQASYH